MTTKRWSAFLAAGLLCLGAVSLAAADEALLHTDLDWRVSSSLNYESGDFGTGTRSSSFYVPVTLKRYLGDWSFSITVPYLRQTTDGKVTNVGGKPTKVGTGRSGATTRTESGLGDIIVRGGYALLKEDPEPFDLALAAKIKLPTADENKGLGTGEFDGGAGVEFGKLVSPGWTVLADGYYTLIGDPQGVNLRNQLALDVGVAHLVSEDLTATVLLEGSNALVPGESAPVDLRALLDYRVSQQGALFTGLLVGLSDGSPDYGVSVGGSLRF